MAAEGVCFSPRASTRATRYRDPSSMITIKATCSPVWGFCQCPISAEMVAHLGGKGSSDATRCGGTRCFSSQMGHVKFFASSNTRALALRLFKAWYRCLILPCPVAECKRYNCFLIRSSSFSRCPLNFTFQGLWACTTDALSSENIRKPVSITPLSTSSFA